MTTKRDSPVTDVISTFQKEQEHSEDEKDNIEGEETYKTVRQSPRYLVEGGSVYCLNFFNWHTRIYIPESLYLFVMGTLLSFTIF